MTVWHTLFGDHLLKVLLAKQIMSYPKVFVIGRKGKTIRLFKKHTESLEDPKAPTYNLHLNKTTFVWSPNELRMFWAETSPIL